MKVKCNKCEKFFEQNGGSQDEPICYGCALTSIIGEKVPESRDMYTASLISGEMSKLDWREMQAEMRHDDPGAFIDDDECSYCRGDMRLCPCRR